MAGNEAAPRRQATAPGVYATTLITLWTTSYLFLPSHYSRSLNTSRSVQNHIPPLLLRVTSRHRYHVSTINRLHRLQLIFPHLQDVSSSYLANQSIDTARDSHDCSQVFHSDMAALELNGETRNESNAPIVAQSKICWVAPKATGVVSLIIQSALLIVSVMISIFFFYHVGGYEYMGWNENSTMLESVYHIHDHPSTITTIVQLSTLSPTTTESTSKEILSNITLDEADVLGMDQTFEILENEYIWNDNDSLPKPRSFDSFIAETNETLDGILAEQVPNTTIYINIVDAQLDMLELIRMSTLVYLVICIFWMISLLCLLFSIKFEILDLVSINAICLTIAVLYVIIHALFIAVLLYYQHNMTWRTMAIVIGSAVVLVTVALLGGLCLALIVGWYKYIVYGHNDDKCYCISCVASLVKGRTQRRRASQSRGAEYALPEATRHSDIPYADQTVQNFSAF